MRENNIGVSPTLPSLAPQGEHSSRLCYVISETDEPCRHTVTSAVEQKHTVATMPTVSGFASTKISHPSSNTKRFRHSLCQMTRRLSSQNPKTKDNHVTSSRQSELCKCHRNSIQKTAVCATPPEHPPIHVKQRHRSAVVDITDPNACPQTLNEPNERRGDTQFAQSNLVTLTPEEFPENKVTMTSSTTDSIRVGARLMEIGKSTTNTIRRLSSVNVGRK